MVILNIFLNIVMIFLFIANKKYTNSQRDIRECNKLIIVSILIIVILLVRFSLLQYPDSTAGPILDVVSVIMSMVVFFRVLKMSARIKY